jgi:hypothetical protein
MPIHDWTRVNASIFHDFRHEWIRTIKRALNSGLLPSDYYALAEWIERRRIVVRHSSGDRLVAVVEIVSPADKADRHGLSAFVQNAVQLFNTGVHLLVIDLFPPGPCDPAGIHGAIWSEMIECDLRLPLQRPLTLVSYAAGKEKAAYLEPLAVGDLLQEMPLFLTPESFVGIPLEATYGAAFDGVPQRWREVLAPAAP